MGPECLSLGLGLGRASGPECLGLGPSCLGRGLHAWSAWAWALGLGLGPSCLGLGRGPRAVVPGPGLWASGPSCLGRRAWSAWASGLGTTGEGGGRAELRLKEPLSGPPAIFSTATQEGRHILTITQSLIRV